MLTAILSSFNEVHNEVFWDNLDLLKLQPNLQIIVIDGGSHDSTFDRLKQMNLTLLSLPGTHRADRYNWGLESAKGDLVLLVHPRTSLTHEALSFLLSLKWTKCWGAFRHSFDMQHPLLKFTSWYSNYVRGLMGGVFYLDHCLVLSADLKDQVRFPSVALFEDTYFSRNLRKIAWPKLLPHTLKTSAVRFRKNGLLWQSVLNQFLKILFLIGVSDQRMHRIYEKGLSLNQKH